MEVPFLTYNATEIIFENCPFSKLTYAFILANCTAMPDTGADRIFLEQQEMIRINAGTFGNLGGGLGFSLVWVRYNNATLAIDCPCNEGNQFFKCHYY